MEHWPALKREFNIRKLYGKQKAACVGITGAIKSCPTGALNMILRQLPIDVFLQKVATFSAMKRTAMIKDTVTWNMKSYGHSDILNHLETNLKRSDYISSQGWISIVISR